MKTTKKLLFLFLVMSVFLMSLVAAANTVTLVTPAQDAVISGATYVLNGTVDTNTFNMTSATFYYKISGGSWTSIGTTANDTLVSFLYTWDTTALVDDDGLVINVTVSNETEIVTEDTSTGVDIDNGLPTCTWSGSSFTDHGSISGDDSFTLTTVADNTIGVDSGIVFMNSLTDSVTTSGNACSEAYTATSFSLTAGSPYTYIMQITDGNSNSTNCTERTIVYRDVGPMGGITVGEEEPTGIAAIGETISSAWSNFVNAIRAFINKIIGK